MSTIMSVASTAALTATSKAKNDGFVDLPLIDRTTRLSVIELKKSDKQLTNELIYRWCRVLTRLSRRLLNGSPEALDKAASEARKVLILDMTASLNPVRLATTLRRDERRMRMIGVARGCKINSTFVTLSSYLGRQSSLPSSLKLVVIYHDEFFIIKTIGLIKEFLQNRKCHVVLIVPRLDRQENDVLNLTSNYQKLKCDFSVKRHSIGPAPPESSTDAYQARLNEIYIQRYPTNKFLPDKVEGDLKDDGLHIRGAKPPIKVNRNSSGDDGTPAVKRIKSVDQSISMMQ